jgi:uncharacterized protein DUF4232
MGTHRSQLLVLLAATGVLAVAAGTVRADAGLAPCSGSQLSGTFSVVPGSAGAGQISYVLRLRNRSQDSCFVSGLPVLRLLGKAGKPLPTHVWPTHPGALTAIRVELAPGAYAAATARFSPDVPGVGEQQIGQCERTAFRARVRPPSGTGTLLVLITPPTPVCEQGRLVFSAIYPGRAARQG